MEIKPYSKNPKKHPDSQLKAIAKSIKEFSWQQPIVVDKEGVIIVGHGRWFAYEKYKDEMNLPEPEIKQASNLTKQQVKAYRLADNKLNESDWDIGLVLEELKSLDEDLLNLTGFDKDLLIEPDAKDDIIPDSAPKRAKLGDVWGCGRHRVGCMDSTIRENVEKLMDGKKADMVFTSPPYNMANRSYYNKYKDNLESNEYIEFNLKVIRILEEFVKGFLFWNINYNKNSRSEWIEIFHKILTQTGFKFLESIIWDKGHGMPITQQGALTRQYEFILAVGKEDEIDKYIDYNFIGFNGEKAVFNKKTEKKLSNYWYVNTFKSQINNLLACFPVALPTKAIKVMTKENDIVLDPFSGSGSTLIACEKTERICYGMEIDEYYCDIILKRYEDYTGKKAIKIL